MNTNRIALLGTLAVFVAVWVSSATLPPSAPPMPVQPAKKDVRGATRAANATSRDVTSFDLNDAAERLRARLTTHTTSRAMIRNPFEFGQTPAPRLAAGPASAVAAVAIAPPAPVDLPPPFTLTGVAERKVGEAIERTAILSGNDQLHYAKPGARLLGRYEVTAVGADAVELRDADTGRITRLGLR
jgi:hypothetical protein